MKSILALLLSLTLLGGHVRAGVSFPGETIDDWHGFTRHRFQVDGCAAWVVEPKTALPGQPWSWCDDPEPVVDFILRHASAQ